MELQETTSKSNRCVACRIKLDRTNTTWYRQKNYIHKCNDCVRKEKREWAAEARKRDPKGTAERSRRWQQKQKVNHPKKYTASQMRTSARKRAIALSIDFDITTQDVLDISPTKCPVFGFPLKYGGGRKSKYSASLDRIDPVKGYVKGNIAVISLLANAMKNEATKDELRQFANWVLTK